MNKVIFSFLITSIAGISTVLGTLPIFFNIKNTKKIINSSLSLSSGVMACVSLFSLIPESYLFLIKKFNNIKSILFIFLCIIIGFLFTYLINKIFDSKTNKLYKIGIISMIALIIHNIPEGILTFSVTNQNIYLGISIAISIMLHNIPEGISISVPIYYATKSRKKAVINTIISGFSEILGAFISFIFLSKYINYFVISIILSITSGIMLYISFFELFPISYKYNKKRTILFFLVGFLIMIIFK